MTGDIFVFEPSYPTVKWTVRPGDLSKQGAMTTFILDPAPQMPDLSEEVARLREKMAVLERLIPSAQAESPRELPREEAKELILRYYLTNGPAFTSDVAAALQLDALTVFELAEELDAEGLLRDVQSAT